MNPLQILKRYREMEHVGSANRVKPNENVVSVSQKIGYPTQDKKHFSNALNSHSTINHPLHTSHDKIKGIKNRNKEFVKINNTGNDEYIDTNLGSTENKAIIDEINNLIDKVLSNIETGSFYYNVVADMYSLLRLFKTNVYKFDAYTLNDYKKYLQDMFDVMANDYHLIVGVDRQTINLTELIGTIKLQIDELIELMEQNQDKSPYERKLILANKLLSKKFKSINTVYVEELKARLKEKKAEKLKLKGDKLRQSEEQIELLQQLVRKVAVPNPQLQPIGLPEPPLPPASHARSQARASPATPALLPTPVTTPEPISSMFGPLASLAQYLPTGMSSMSGFFNRNRGQEVDGDGDDEDDEEVPPTTAVTGHARTRVKPPRPDTPLLPTGRQRQLFRDDGTGTAIGTGTGTGAGAGAGTGTGTGIVDDDGLLGTPLTELLPMSPYATNAKEHVAKGEFNQLMTALSRSVTEYVETLVSPEEAIATEIRPAQLSPAGKVPKAEKSRIQRDKTRADVARLAEQQRLNKVYQRSIKSVKVNGGGKELVFHLYIQYSGNIPYNIMIVGSAIPTNADELFNLHGNSINAILKKLVGADPSPRFSNAEKCINIVNLLKTILGNPLISSPSTRGT